MGAYEISFHQNSEQPRVLFLHPQSIISYLFYSLGFLYTFMKFFCRILTNSFSRNTDSIHEAKEQTNKQIALADAL